ncbi:hypothetical protein Tco_1264483 [Tanacetum coccineum]
MTTLADKSLLSGGDNKPPMLEKHLYDSWKSRMELYMMNRPHGRMILASVEKGPLVWPTITVDGVTRPKEYTELTPAETIQADCDIKAINIILQGLPTEIYALVSQHRVAKDIWEKIRLLMQGTSLTKQEREYKLYDEFDKFTYKKGESLHEYYLRFTLLLNDMNIYKMPLEQFHVNTKFLNTLPAEWSKFVTDVNLDHLLNLNNTQSINHQYLIQLPIPPTIIKSQSTTTFSLHHHPFLKFEYFSPVNQQSEFSQLDSGLTIPVFKHDDDPIDSINHVMSFLSAVVTSCYPTTNNQLRNSSNPRQQATINDGRVNRNNIQRRQISYDVGTIRTFTPGEGRSNSGKQRLLVVTTLKAQASGQILNEEELTFLADPGIPKAQATQTVITHNAAYQAMIWMHMINCDDSTRLSALMAIPSSEQSNVVNHSETKITSDSNIIPYSQYVQSQEKDTVIKKLKERIHALSGKTNDDKIKQVLEEIETINIELDHRVTKLIAENEHLKQTYKQLYDSIKPARIRSKE